MRSGFLLALFIPVETAASDSLVVVGSTVELPAPVLAAPPAERCQQRLRLLTPMLVAYARLQAAAAHSTLRALAAGAAAANPSPVAQWTVRSAPQAYAVKAGVAVEERLGAGPHGLSPSSLVILDGHGAQHATRGRRLPQLRRRFKDAGRKHKAGLLRQISRDRDWNETEQVIELREAARRVQVKAARSGRRVRPADTAAVRTVRQRDQRNPSVGRNVSTEPGTLR